MIGSQLLHYKILKKLGAGGMGEVYLAEDLNLGRQVALKILAPERFADSEARRRFLHEARAQAMLSHPNVATFHEVNEHENVAFIVMEYIEGEPLAAIMKRDELDCHEILDFAIQMTEGIKAAHDHGVIHRDIKPENIMISRDRHVKIMDFGLARWKGASTLTQKGTRLGSVYYMSPEQAETRRVDHRSDLFSLGVILYELFCRRRPFEGDSEAVVLYSVVHDEPQPVARYSNKCPPSLEQAIHKCLHKDPEERYQSAADLLADLKHARHEFQSAGQGSRTRSAVPQPRRVPRRSGLLVAGLLVILVAGVALIPAARRAILAPLGLGRPHIETYLVVIPFTMVGNRPADQVLLDGLLETVTSKLTQMEQFERSLRVVPASDVRRLGITSVREARLAFGATHAVTGSLQDLEDRIRVTMNLVDAHEEVQLRSSVIDEASSSASEFQDTTVLALASMMNIELLPPQERVLTAGDTRVPAASDAYLRGRGYLQRHIEGFGIYSRRDATQLDSALAMLQSAVERDPHYALAEAALGEAFWYRFQQTRDSAWLEPAMSHTLHAIELDDEVVSAYLTRGQIHDGTGRYLEALHDFKQALKLDSLSYDAYRGMANTFNSINQPAEAEAMFNKLIEMKPDDLKARLQLGYFYLGLGRYDDARKVAEAVAALQPEGYHHWNKIGDLYGAIFYGLGEWDKAREIWEKSLTYAPSFAALSNLGTIHYVQGHYPDAASYYEQALKLDDSDYRIWINLASVYEQIPDRSQDAPPAYRRAVELGEAEARINPRDAFLLVALADCYVVLGDTTRAVSLTTRALDLAPDDIEVVVRSGLVHEHLGRRDAAVELIGRALAQGYSRAQLEAQPDLSELMADSRLPNSHSNK